MQNYFNKKDLPVDPVVFMNTYGDMPGGVAIAGADFSDGDIIPAATPIFADVNGLYHALKLAKLQASITNTATVIPVLKGHKFKVGSIVALNSGGKASTVTAIDTSNANFDNITVDLTLGAAAAAGAPLMEAAATSTTTTSAPKFYNAAYGPVLVTAYGVQIKTGDNHFSGAWLRADMFADRAPAVPAAVKALNPQLQWI